MTIVRVMSWQSTVAGLSEAAAFAKRLSGDHGLACAVSLQGDRVVLRVFSPSGTGSAEAGAGSPARD